MPDADITVLLVDDEPDVAETTRAYLEHVEPRLSVETAGTADEGLERLAAGGVDGIVSDFEMPGRDGIEFLESVRAAGYDLPFVLFTGKGSEEVAADAISAGATDYLQKAPGTEQYTILANRVVRAVERRRADQAVEAANERLATVFDRVTDAVLAMDSSFRYTYVNAEAERLLGVDADDLVGTEAWEAFPQLEETDFGPAIRRAMANQESETVEAYWPPLDAWYFVRIYPAEDGLSVYFRDISDRMRREQELADERERYRQLVESAPVGIVGYDAAGDVIYANETAARLAGVDDPAALEGRPAIGFIHEDDRETARDRMAAVIGGDRAGEPLEYRLVGADDRVRHVSVSGAPMTYDGEPAGQVVINDVTALKERQRLLSALNRATAEIAACERHEDVYERLVEAGERVLEFDLALAAAVEDGSLVTKAVAADVDESGYYQRIPLDADDNLAARVARNGEPSVVADLDTEGVAPASASYRSALTVPIGDRGVFQAVAEATDAFDETDVEHAELLLAHVRETLERLDREAEIEARTGELARQHERLESFASLVSHDLRNPLSVVQGRLELAREHRDDEDLASASRALDRAFALIDELLAVASGQRPPMDPAPISLAEAADHCWQPVTGADGDLRVETDRVIQADESRLYHLLENLFNNAVEHGSTGRRTPSDDAVEHGSTSNQPSADDAVEHGSTGRRTPSDDAVEHGGSASTPSADEAADGGGVKVTVGDIDGGFYVADDGVGIPREDRERVFERSYSTRRGGTGVGLSLVRQVAEAHDWLIDLTESETGGVRFEFTGVAVLED